MWWQSNHPGPRRRGAVRGSRRAFVVGSATMCAGARQAAGRALGGGLGSSRVTVEARPSDRPAPRRPRRHGGGRGRDPGDRCRCGSRFPETSGQLDDRGADELGVGACATPRACPTIYADNAERPLPRAGLRQRPGPLLRDGPAPPRHGRAALRARRQRRHRHATRSSARWAGAGSPSRSCPSSRPRRGSTSRRTPTASTRTSSRPSRRRRCRSSTPCSRAATPSYRVEPWTPVDSLAWLKAMAWDLRGDYNDELTRARLSRSGTLDQADRLLYPPYPVDRNQPILSQQDWQPASAQSDQAASPAPAALTALRTPDGRRRRRLGPRGPVDAVPATLGPRRRHRLQLVGRLGLAHDDGQAAARQRPAPRRCRSPASGHRSTSSAAR